MAFVDPFLLVVTLVMSCILIIGNLYFVAKYAHPADSAFGSSTACKAIIVSVHIYLATMEVNSRHIIFMNHDHKNIDSCFYLR
jgi:hypothetical protein